MPSDTGGATRTWKLIHQERQALADTLNTLTPERWAAASLCGGWTVRIAAAHVVAGAEQTVPAFFKGLGKHAFRFNTMMDRVARRIGEAPPEEIVARLRS